MIQMKKNTNILLKNPPNDLKHLEYSKALIEYSNDMQDVYKKYQRVQPR